MQDTPNLNLYDKFTYHIYIPVRGWLCFTRVTVFLGEIDNNGFSRYNGNINFVMSFRDYNEANKCALYGYLQSILNIFVLQLMFKIEGKRSKWLYDNKFNYNGNNIYLFHGLTSIHACKGMVKRQINLVAIRRLKITHTRQITPA